MRHIGDCPFHGKVHRKVWAFVIDKGIRTSRVRVLGLMRENRQIAHQALPGIDLRAPRAHDGAIIPVDESMRYEAPA